MREKERKKKEKRARVAQFTVDVIDLSGYHLIVRDLFLRLGDLSSPIYAGGMLRVGGTEWGRHFRYTWPRGRLCTLFGTSQSCFAFRFEGIVVVLLVNACRPIRSVTYTLKLIVSVSYLCARLSLYFFFLTFINEVFKNIS